MNYGRSDSRRKALRVLALRALKCLTETPRTLRDAPRYEPRFQTEGASFRVPAAPVGGRSALWLPNDIEFSGERKRVRCNEGLGAVARKHGSPLFRNGDRSGR